MTKAKKTLSVLLAVLMVLGTCLFSAFAVAPAENTYKATLTVKPDVATATAGQTVTFTVALTTTYAASTASAIVEYNDAVFENPVVTPSEDLFGAFPATEGEKYVNLPTNRAGAFVVDKSNKEPAVLKDAKLFDVTLTVKANAPAGKTIVSVVDDRKAENHEGSLYCGRYDAATNKVVTYGQNFVLNNAEVTIEGGAAPVEPTLVTKGTGYVDEARQYVYGITPGQPVENFFEVNNGRMNVIKSDLTESGTTNGTGAILQVLTMDGQVKKTYTVVVFGDLDGNGLVQPSDEAYLTVYNRGDKTHSFLGQHSLARFAADVDASGSVQPADSSYMHSYNMGNKTSITVNPYEKAI